MANDLVDTPLWAAAAAALRSGLARAGADVEVHVLGRDDELADRPLPVSGERVVLLAGESVLIPPARGSASCPQCAARRWHAAQSSLLREAIEFGEQPQAAAGPPVAAPAVIGAVLALLAGEHDLLTRLRIDTLEVSTYPVIPDPACPRCGHGHLASQPGQQDFTSSRKRPGSFRSCSVGEYPLSVPALINPVSGLLGRGHVAEISLPSTAAIWGSFSTRTPDDIYEIFWGGHASSFDASVRIGLLEGLERYAGMMGPVDARRASRAELVAEGVRHLDPRACGLYRDEFYADADGVVPFTDDLVIAWVPAHSLRDGGTVLVPEITAYYRSSDNDARFVQECSNGCASGSSLTEAAYCGLMELIERDAFLLSWYGALPLREIDPRSSARTDTRMMIDRLELYGYRARFFDARITFAVPVVIGVAERIDGGLGAMCVGGGSGMDAEDALAGALAEVSTDSLNLRSRVRRDLPRLTEMAADFDQIRRIHDHPMVFGLPEMARHADFLLRREEQLASLTEIFGERPAPETGDLLTDLQWCVAHLAEAGLEVLVVDQTTAEQRELGVCTASVIVPGLLPLDFGWYRQRALDMPRMRTALRAAGWVDRDLDRADLHLVPHPFP